MQLQVPPYKVRDLPSNASRLLLKTHCPIKQVASFIGKVYTDASDQGWGIVSQAQTWHDQWTPQECTQHINWKELMVIWKAIHIPHFIGKCLQIYCNNMTTIAYVNNFGGTGSPHLMDLANRIWTHCLTINTRLHLKYIPCSHPCSIQRVLHHGDCNSKSNGELPLSISIIWTQHGVLITCTYLPHDSTSSLLGSSRGIGIHRQ